MIIKYRVLIENGKKNITEENMLTKYKWKKQGQIFCPDNNYTWMKTHASNPTAEYLSGDIFRVYFSTRNENNVSCIAYADIDLNNPTVVTNLSTEPVLEPGDLGTFDDSGTSMACILNFEGNKYLYYLGWNLCKNVPWHNSIGLAVYNNSTGKFEKYSKAPILDRHEADPYSLSYPYVLNDDGLLRMYYGSNLKWGANQEDMAHLMKYAYSDNPITWTREGKIALAFKDDSEYAMSKPCVIKEHGIYKMWYSFRGEAYRIGYAESEDGISWKRKDEEVGITVSESGWDSESIEYPFVFTHKNTKFMLYNGNRYGLTGFGIAILD
jgi:predicted GH43/DUF377 family glycosyl hydrolase